MIKLLLLTIWAILVIIVFIATLAFLLMQIFPTKPKTIKKAPIIIPDMPLPQMEEIAQNKSSDAASLEAVLRAIAAHHPIEPKKDGKTSKAAKHLLDLIFTMGGHKNMSNELQTAMYTLLSEANPSYKKDFDRASNKR
jgi:hypothetical protein